MKKTKSAIMGGCPQNNPDVLIIIIIVIIVIIIIAVFTCLYLNQQQYNTTRQYDHFWTGNFPVADQPFPCANDAGCELMIRPGIQCVPAQPYAYYAGSSTKLTCNAVMSNNQLSKAGAYSCPNPNEGFGWYTNSHFAGAGTTYFSKPHYITRCQSVDKY